MSPSTPTPTSTHTPTPFTSVLVANRGEIARRVIAAAHRRGLQAIAIHSDADADAPFVHDADAAIHLPGDAPADTYLNVDAILAAARASGADAVHPGYGFLSENVAFARAVIDAGLTWIGPPPEAIAAMGSKIEAKQRMAEAGVPLLRDLTPDTVTEADLPVIVKASAGGGGRGMRVVRSLDQLAADITAARREAGSAFGDDAVFVERYIESGRHIEVQLMADAHGTVWALGERECSIQRRHQKVIEEAPSPLVERLSSTNTSPDTTTADPASPTMREQLFTAARNAATAIGYIGAGTVEFLATDEGEFFFLEMNTRLQVEHPVTEATTGTDLVALQFDMAAGLPLPGPTPPPTSGWAIEARLYAEDPHHDFRPMSGELTRLDIDHVIAHFEGPHRPGIRLDAGPTPTPGHPARIGIHYDAMLAKVIAFAPTRYAATALLSGALRSARIHGLGTNRDLLVRILDDPDFRAGNLSTAFLSPDRLSALSTPLADATTVLLSAGAAAAATEACSAASMPTPAVPIGFRNVGTATSTHSFHHRGEDLPIRLRRTRRSVDILSATGDTPLGRVIDVTVPDVGTGAVLVRLDLDGVTRPFRVSRYPGGVLGVDSALGPVDLLAPPRYPDPEDTPDTGSLLAPMPGTIVGVDASPGEKVSPGQVLLRLEAMKMEHSIKADFCGVIDAIHVQIGDNISAGTVLAVVSDDTD